MATLVSFCSTILGFIVGSISLLGVIVAICQPQLPSNKIRALEALLCETETIFNEALEDGLLGPEFTQAMRHRLTELKDRTHSIRTHAYSATSLCKDIIGLLIGTSAEIGHICQSVKELRADIIISSETRRRICKETSPVIITNATSSPPIPAPGPRVQDPPPIAPGISDSAASACGHDNDSMQDNLDIRTIDVQKSDINSSYISHLRPSV